MAESTNNLTLVVNQQDASGVNVISRTIGPISYAGAVGDWFKGLLTTTGATAFTLPTANALQVYIKNTHTGAVLTVIGTPQSGASATLCKLYPSGGTFVYWATTVTGTTGTSGAGFTALSLTSDTLNATFEAFIGG